MYIYIRTPLLSSMYRHTYYRRQKCTRLIDSFPFLSFFPFKRTVQRTIYDALCTCIRTRVFTTKLTSGVLMTFQQRLSVVSFYSLRERVEKNKVPALSSLDVYYRRHIWMQFVKKTSDFRSSTVKLYSR